MAWMSFALAPAVLVLAAAQGGAWLGRVALALLLAVAVDAAALSLRGSRRLAEPSAAMTGLLVLLCLPAGASLAALVLGVVIALLLGKHAFGGLGENPFNPAMLGVAVVMLAFPVVVSAASSIAWLAAAYLLGGIVLLARGVVGWQAPLGMLAGAAIAAAGAIALGAPPASLVVALASPAVLLAAFFVATDPVSGCAYPRARILFGLGAGVLMVLIERARPGLGLPCAILLMNFAAPWLDALVAPARPAGSR
jgi:electron transport complex protein RnfD